VATVVVRKCGPACPFNDEELWCTKLGCYIADDTPGRFPEWCPLPKKRPRPKKG
jgi:hypothetical protein